ncbi:hypothetical protein M8C21_027036 [Ambrosia artemisiifolia]|uniref:EF-hand domain-containing protein n=1 Tax=Ambrosia artemisiifolia TaxID=4212 RepID=A0AAD5DA13_AMBAR|nr:hypothetical protein M8C21_027036 [Ambrosia artemisiifolia]
MIIYLQFLDGSKIHVQNKNHETKPSKTSASFHDQRSFAIIQGDEVETVMGNLGIFCNFEEGENFATSLSSEDLLNMFEEEQPRLDEVKEAFEVFDENKDGFIDASELQRVLFALGLEDKASMYDCKKMIKVFDDNKDGRIDFDEFTKFMEGTF